MPIIFIICGIFELLIIFDVITFKKKISKIFSVIFLMVFLVSFFIGNVSVCDIAFNVIHAFVFVLLFFRFAVRVTFRLVLLAVLIISIYYFLITASFVVDVGVVSFLCLLLGALFSRGMDQKFGMVLLLSYGILIIDLVGEYGMATFATIDFVNVFTLMIKVFLVDIVIRKIIGEMSYEIKNNISVFITIN